MEKYDENDEMVIEILNSCLQCESSTQECIDFFIAKGVTKERLEEILYLFTYCMGRC